MSVVLVFMGGAVIVAIIATIRTTVADGLRRVPDRAIRQ